MYELLGYVAVNSRTFGNFLDFLLRYQNIWTDALEFSLESAASNTSLAYVYRIGGLSAEDRRQESENMLSVIVIIGRTMTAANWMPRETHFEHPSPRRVAEHERLFGEFVYFNKPQTKLIFDSDITGLPIIEADPRLFSVLHRYAEDLLLKINPQNMLSARVSELLGKSLAGEAPSIEFVSKQIGASPRTLQRKLNKEGTSYHKLLEGIRRELSLQYLKNSEMAICEISYLLGFSEQSAFHRAFRRWTGMTPKEFQRPN
jgi:AraC-like DNA-binding protein